MLANPSGNVSRVAPRDRSYEPTTVHAFRRGTGTSYLPTTTADSRESIHESALELAMCSGVFHTRRYGICQVESREWEPAVLSGPCLFALVTLEMTAVKLRQRDFQGLYRVVA